MKLNPDCIREILLSLEDLYTLQPDDDDWFSYRPVSFDKLCAAVPKHSRGDVLNCLINLEEAGYIIGSSTTSTGYANYSVQRLTFRGHDFLETIRNEKHWKKVNALLASVRNYSLDAITAASKGITESAIAHLLKNPEKMITG